MADDNHHWVLFSGKSSYVGAFETADETLRFVYWDFIYPNYRGRKSELPAMEWQDNGYGQIRGYIDGKLAYTIEKRANPASTEIHSAYRGMGLHEWAAGNYQSFDDWLNIVEVKQDAL